MHSFLHTVWPVLFFYEVGETDGNHMDMRENMTVKLIAELCIDIHFSFQQMYYTMYKIYTLTHTHTDALSVCMLYLYLAQQWQIGISGI